MKKIPSIIPFLLIILLSMSCKRLIEIPANPNQLSSQQIFSDSATILAAVAGVYNNFYVTVSYFQINNGGITAYTGLSSDELVNGPGYDPYVPPFYANGLLPDNAYVDLLWSSSYNGIYTVNACLEGITGNTAISDVLQQQLIGEMKAVRALYYFNLVNLYGAVPIALTTDYKKTATLPRAPVDSVYDRIIADLTAARQLLTPSYPSAGRARPNLFTASALLSKVYLYRQQWQAAADVASEVLNSGQYSLNPDLNQVFLDGSNEAIWQLPAVGNYSQTGEAYTFIPYASSIIPGYFLSNVQVNAFETGDQRMASWTAVNQVTTNGVTTAYYYPFKYKNKSNNAPTTEDYMVLRLGEQYLIRAEALAHQNKPDSAVADINQVRLRAGLTAATAITQTDILAAVMHERQTELFCEWGNRWYDLKRTGTADAVLGADKSSWKTTAALFPIPLPELNSNSFLIQNPGY